MERVDVVVVGAGLSGLVAARDLEAAGCTVAVVEARDRVGGRVHSHRFENGQWCERGAEFLNANDSALLALCAELGLALLERPPACTAATGMLDLGGRLAPAGALDQVAAAERVYDEALGELAVRAVAARERGDESLLEELDRADLSSLLREVTAGFGAAARVWLGRLVRTEWMLPPDELSLLFVGEQVASSGRAEERERFRLLGGNDRIASRLAEQLTRPVRLGTAVASIDAAAGSVHLADGRTLGGDAVVATVPLPVLGRLWVDMPRELAAVGYGQGGKVSFSLARRLWLDLGRSGHVLSDRAWGEMWDTSDVQPGDGGVLTVLLSSHDGVTMLALPDCLDRLRSEADRVLPGVRSLIRSSVMTDWSNDPWSLGAYAAFGPGQLRAARTALTRRHGRLWLAGEHTDDRSGFMEGAVRSGARVAAGILAGR